MKKYSLSNDSKILMVFSLLTIVLRLVTLMEVSPGGDNIDYWYFSKAIINNYPYGELFHRSIRWGIIIPTMLFQLLFSNSAWVIYLIPLFMSVLLNYSIYLVGTRVFTKKAVYLAIILVQIFPYMIRVGSQLFLALFSMNYILLSLYFLLKFTDGNSNNRFNKNLILSIVFMFVAYETKITNLYFLVPFLIILKNKKGFKPIINYCLILLFLYLIEHLCYYILAGYPLGRLQIIMSTHFGSSSMTLGEGVEFDGTFLGLFKRFSFNKFPIYWHLITWLGILAGFVLSRKKSSNKYIKSMLIIIISFIIIQTFGVKSIFPFIPFEDFIVRYFMPILPLLSLLLCECILLYFPIINKFNVSVLFILPVVGFLILGTMSEKLPKSAREYINNPLKPKENNFVKTIIFEKELNDFSKKLNIGYFVTDSSEKNSIRNSHRSLDSVNRLYLRLDNNIGKYNKLTYRLYNKQEVEFLDISGNGFQEDRDFLRVYRMPFHYEVLNNE